MYCLHFYDLLAYDIHVGDSSEYCHSPPTGSLPTLLRTTKRYNVTAGSKCSLHKPHFNVHVSRTNFQHKNTFSFQYMQPYSRSKLADRSGWLYYMYIIHLNSCIIVYKVQFLHRICFIMLDQWQQKPARLLFYYHDVSNDCYIFHDTIIRMERVYYLLVLTFLRSFC